MSDLSPVSRSGNAELLQKLAVAAALNIGGGSTFSASERLEMGGEIAAAILRTLRDHGPAEEMLASARNAPLPLVHIDSLAGRADLEIRSRFAAALTNLIEASEK